MSTLLLLLALAADPRALPARSPEAFITTTVHVQLHASEELDPDLLRALARKGVTLWVSTQSNTLRASTLDTVTRFSEVWISLHGAVSETQARQFEKLSNAGVWLDAKDLDAARRVLGPRRLAVRLNGPLDAALADRLRKLRPSEVRWRAPPEVDLLSWGLFRQLPGRKILFRLPTEIWPADCPSKPSAGEPTMESDVETVLKIVDGAFPCGRGPRVQIPLEVERWVIQSLLVREPSTELVIDVGADSEKVSLARQLLDDLGLK